MKAKKNQSDITATLLSWYSEHKRELPWRETADPYLIWVSEVILQQTRIAQGTSYYLRFVNRFPNVQMLAEAEEEEVLKLWQGLGYYTRARNLHVAAKQIMSRFNGIFPANYSDILSLKGVGKYTAAAISSIAFHAPYAVVDGNVFRVIARLFAVEVPIDNKEGQRIISEIAQSLIHTGQPGTYNQAIMDFGSLVCTPARPKCAECPLQAVCVAYETKKVSYFPVIRPKPPVRNRYFNYLHIIQGGKTFIQKRNNTDIWKNLYEFPLIETPDSVDLFQLFQTSDFRHLFPEIITLSIDHRFTLKHQLSHQAIHSKFYRVEIAEETVFTPPERLICIDEKELSGYPVSRLTEKYMETI
ncbi:A/G-specific adenine glycosylase [Proteiniphilum sp. UBA1028]|jgi:A/G-specific adenine glycosylase|uniref:A/G-specific adenine glycosylase n=1 Tax=Proteiniphilum sp. UBA1028 TaxID=1947251 RepID=UPI000E8E03D6|nr:A/G-specific adenine glycosylase [Proteiniphilum sp. UBA1028]HBG56833.1 A/G-specific adenine glycosylase [Porphyromonadaceae bacterium]